MKRISGLILVTVLIIGCDNDEKIDPISHKVIEPNISMTSMISYPWTWDDVEKNHLYSFTYDKEGPNSIIQGASGKISLDLNNDKIDDLDFGVRHAYQTDTWPIDEFLIYIGSLGENEISLSDFTNGNIKTYSQGETIDYESFGKTDVFHNYQGAFILKKDALFDFENVGEYYVAVKLNINNKTYYGWILLESQDYLLTLTIKEYAISRIPNKEILIGQID